jgi:hypothetical protein
MGVLDTRAPQNPSDGLPRAGKGQKGNMYRFSRSIYKDLAPYVVKDSASGREATNGHSNGHQSTNGSTGSNANGSHDTHANGNGGGNGHPVGAVVTNRQRLLESCEAAMRRLAYDRRYFAHPSRSLFSEVRMLFPIHEQDRAFRVIDRNVRLAIEFLERLPEGRVGLDGQPSECRAHTRKGTPCRRTPLPGRDYCPSHKHLEEGLEGIDEDGSGLRGPPDSGDPVGAAA